MVMSDRSHTGSGLPVEDRRATGGSGAGQTSPGPSPAPVDDGPAGDVLFQSRCDLAVIGTIRRRVADCMSGAGASEDKIDDFILAVGEIVGNAVKHGGGTGHIELIRSGRRLRCVVRDHGPGFPPDDHAHQHRVRADAEHGRGLWLAFTLCAVVELYTSSRGTRVDLVMDLGDE